MKDMANVFVKPKPKSRKPRVRPKGQRKHGLPTLGFLIAWGIDNLDRWRGPKHCRIKDKEKQIEGRCVKCHRELMLTITRTESLNKIIVTAEKCQEHPERSIILWPQSGIRPDIRMVGETPFDEFLKLYNQRYGNEGPSISLSCKGSTAADSPFRPEHCGCWECQLVELKEIEKAAQNLLDNRLRPDSNPYAYKEHWDRLEQALSGDNYGA